MPSYPPQPKRLAGSASEPTLVTRGSRQFVRSAGPSEGGDGDALDAMTRPGRSGLPNMESSLAQMTSHALYQMPSHSSQYVEPEDLEPGPGTYDLPGAIGSQLLSDKESFRQSSITAKHDRSWAKVMISKDHLNALKARDTPGPGTYIPELVPTQARVRFGSGKRQSFSDNSFRAPGPVYEVTGNPEETKVNIRFGKAPRDRKETSLADTGPGQYETKTVFDGGHLAKSFGASHRAYDKVRFPGSERMNIGMASPGPGAAKPFNNDGHVTSFGRAERLPTNQASKRSPGPGAYENHERPNPFSRNVSCYSFGRPPAKGRMNWKQMRMYENSVWGMQ